MRTEATRAFFIVMVIMLLLVVLVGGGSFLTYQDIKLDRMCAHAQRAWIERGIQVGDAVVTITGKLPGQVIGREFDLQSGEFDYSVRVYCENGGTAVAVGGSAIIAGGDARAIAGGLQIVRLKWFEIEIKKVE